MNQTPLDDIPDEVLAIAAKLMHASRAGWHFVGHTDEATDAAIEMLWHRRAINLFHGKHGVQIRAIKWNRGAAL